MLWLGAIRTLPASQVTARPTNNASIASATKNFPRN
jgi:hypothetical protein